MPGTRLLNLFIKVSKPFFTTYSFSPYFFLDGFCNIKEIYSTFQAFSRMSLHISYAQQIEPKLLVFFI